MPRQALIVEVTPEDLGTLQFLAGMLMGMGQPDLANNIRRIAETVSMGEFEDDEESQGAENVGADVINILEGESRTEQSFNAQESPQYIPEPEPDVIIEELPPGTPPAIPGSLGSGPPPNDNP